jgi:hypothetical protein
LRTGGPVDLLEKLTGERNHHFGHRVPASQSRIARGQERGNTLYISLPEDDGQKSG